MKIIKLYALVLLICSISSELISQEKQIPEWFLNDMESSIGVWIADNSQFISESEPYTHYGIEWSWGLGKTSLKGRLFGLIGGKEQGDFWEFRQYWDNLKQEAVVEQFGNGGMLGIGTLYLVDENTSESIQTFSTPDGTNWLDRHVTVSKGNEVITTSYRTGESQEWEANRTYIWKKL